MTGFTLAYAVMRVCGGQPRKNLDAPLYAVHEQVLEEFPADVSLVPDQLAVDFIQETFVLQRHPVIGVAWCYAEIEQFPLLVADNMKLETEEPAHGTLSPGGNALEHLVHMYALVLADTQGRAVHEADACTLSTEHFLHEECEGKGYILLQLHETVVGYQFAEEMAAVFADFTEIEMLEAAVARTVGHNQDGHNLRRAE